ncbi:transposase [Spiroplasma sp. SV19]|uniref:transposase n=1 Tax=Spiroplasma sp. SV19 TaxID=2570468 RepID=UPI0024B6CC3B|nr:transposase [Spiroplasma sp. SV19]
MGQKIRNLMKENYKFDQNSIIEIDETFVGGLEQNKHYNKKWKNNKKPKEYGPWGKQVLIGIIDRNNKKVKVFHTKDRKTKTIKKLIKAELNKKILYILMIINHINF